MAQQTALEWLVEKVFGEHTEVWKNEIEQAKQMEKERRKEDFKIGYNQGYIDAQCNHTHDEDNLANEHKYLNQ